MKVLFKEIRAGNLAAVTARLDANPSLVDAVAKAPPKKDDGQSTLQVAVKSGQFAVAHLLMERGADVNFIETSTVNSWNIPVLHDAIRGAVFSTRFTVNRARVGEPPRIEVLNPPDQFGRAFAVLKELVTRGADPNALDSAGNTALLRAVLDTRQITRNPMTDDLAEDLHQVFDLLLDAGGDPQWVDIRTKQSIVDTVAGTPIEPFLRTT